MSDHLFYYFGDDEAYYRTLIGEFAKNTRLNVTFKKEFSKDEAAIQSLFLKVYHERPSCIFIDFSKHTQDYMHLARIIMRTKLDHKIITVGLVDYLSPKEVILESNATGVNLTHIKSAESFDVAYDVAKLIAFDQASEHGFARAALKDDTEAGIPVKIGYIHADGLHFETDFKLSRGEKIRLNHQWKKDKIVPSQEIFIRNVSTKNLFYHFNYAVDGDFLFVDDFIPPEGMDPDVISQKRAERDMQVRHYKKQLLRWIDDNQTRSLEKKAKILIVDRDFHLYLNSPRTDKYSYTIRCVSQLDDPSAEYERLEPQVIAYALDKDGVLDPKNTMEKLDQMMKMLKAKYMDSSPFVVTFNCNISSTELQNRYSYPQIMSSPSDINVEVLLKMADIFDKKLSKTFSIPTEKKVFLRKTNTASIAEIMIPIRILKLSETDMLFQTEHELPSGINLHLTGPVDMFIHVIPMKSQGKIPVYLGLIHCLGEVEKKELRRYVNAVFFRDHDARVEADVLEFKRLNELKLQEMQKKEQEENEDSPDKETEPSDS